jgi:hypothetical protein
MFNSHNEFMQLLVFKKITCVNMVTIKIYVCNSFNNILKNQKGKVNVSKA